MPRTPSTALPFADSAARFLVRRGRGSRMGRVTEGVVLAALVVLLVWTSADLANLLQASR